MTAPMYYTLASDGETPIATDDVLTWGRWFETADRVVARTTIGTVKVSTVFIGLDHGFGRGAPVLWESMVFGLADDDLQQRYTSAREARAGHECLVERVRQIINTEGST
jgi:hypothetical protein